MRLHRATLVAWGVGLTAFGAVFGSLVGEVQAFLDENPQLQEFFGAAGGGGLVEAFLRTVMLMLALLATGYAISATLMLRNEERDGRAEPLLATGITRARWLGSHLLVAFGGGAAVLIGAAAGAGTLAAIERGQASWLADTLAAGLVHVPPMWLTAALVVALYGVLPRAVALGWVVLVYAAVVGFMGDLLDLPERARALSPFHHVPDLPGGEVDLLPLAVLALTAAALVVVGLLGLRRRDIDVA